MLNLASRLDFISGTLSKGFGVFGGYVVGSKQGIDCIRTYAPNYIFTTSLPPAIVAAGLESVRHLRSSQVERNKLHSIADYIKQ